VVKFIQTMKNNGLMERSEKCQGLWERVYPQLTADRSGIIGAATSRAEAQVLRLSMIYALLDCSQEIRVQHLKAALAIWKYCEASAEFIFGASQTNPIADKILQALRESSVGLTRNDLFRNVFSCNKPKAEIDKALSQLQRQGHAIQQIEKNPVQGRPTERWNAC
jgi:hypothetical protein